MRRRRRKFRDLDWTRSLYSLHGLETNSIKSAYNLSWRRWVDIYSGGNVLTRNNDGSLRCVGINSKIDKLHNDVYLVNSKFRKIEP